MELQYAIESPLPTSDAPLCPGLGTALIVEGWAFCPGEDIHALALEFDGQRFPIIEWRQARPDVLVSHQPTSHAESVRALRSGFWIAVPVPPLTRPRTAGLRLLARLENQRTRATPLHEVHLQPSDTLAFKPLQEPLPPTPRVCICLAAFNPSESAFRRQIDSIRAQTYPHWTCLVQDDWSCSAGAEVIRRVLADDPRFILQRNARNLGFYHNFERLLARIPPHCDLICLADQDDFWYPEKLAKLVAAFTPGTTLAYADMRIVDDSGKILSNTYWSTRRNNYTDLETLFFANTITGAAAMFRAGLLPRILPFPPRYGPVYHDWWIALVALASGRIRFLEEPLHDYYQHAGNIIGWAHAGGGISLSRLASSEAYRHQLVGTARTIHRGECKALAAAAQLLPLRLPDSPHHAVISRLARINRQPLRTLLGQVLRAAPLRRASVGREKNFFLAHAVTRMHSAYLARHPARLAARFTTSDEAAPQVSSETILPVDTFTRATAPLRLEIRSTEPPRLNMFLATLDFRLFFGGYLATFHLARRLAAFGHRIRFIIHDRCEIQPAAWRQAIRQYPGLEDIFDHVEIAYHHDRTLPLPVSPSDRFIATSCWSAWLADAAARTTGGGEGEGRRFIFLIQDYEPLFVPHGSLHALLHAAYDFNHFPIFSTDLLHQYFRDHHIGIYRPSPPPRAGNSITFQNAVQASAIDPARLARSGPRQCLFYARPGPHAQRNLFELGILALRQAMDEGSLDPATWRFYGIGTMGEPFTIPLARGARLHVLPRMPLKQYAAYLPDFDLGMSLMLSPHPSLVPLEMAAAGLVTITNTYANKTAEGLRALSANLVAAPPTIADLAHALRHGAARVPDLAARITASRINWPTSWDDALALPVIRPLLDELTRG